MPPSSESQALPQWWIRSASNGDVFGPVPVSELADWARQSRVFPEDAVSTDRRSWRTARTVPELGMDTIIATPDGRIHGPLHHDAAALLAEKGKLPEGAKLFSAAELLSREERAAPASDAAEKAVEEAKAAAADSIAEKEREIETLRAAADAAAKAVEEAKAAAADAVAEKEREIETLREAADAAAKAVEEAKADAADAVAEKEREIETLRESADAAAKELAQTREERDAAKNAADAVEKEAAEAKERNANVAAAAEAVSDELRMAKASLETAVAERDAALAKAEAAETAAAEAKAAAAKAKEESDAAVANEKAAETAAAEAKAAAAELEKRMGAQESEMAELADFANARDRESKATIAELERRIAEISAPEVPSPGGEDGPVGDARLVQTLQDRVTDLTRERCALSEKLAAAEASLAVATRPLEADTALVKQFADEALDSLRAALASEKERNDAERTASVQRQNALHDRIADLERALRRQPGEKTRGELAEERSERTISQLRQEIDALREQHKADLGRASENERALEGRLQALQHREAAVREQLRRVEKRTADYDSLTSRLRRREEEIVEAEKQFGEAREQWQVVEQMLRRRIEELEHGAGSLFENDPDADASHTQKLVLPGWVKNMK